MAGGVKAIVAVVCVVVGLVASALVGLRDMAQRPEYCATCHLMQPYVDSWKDSTYLASTHGKLGIPCQVCHAQTMGDLAGEVVSTVRHSYDEPLKEIKLPKEDCLRCHGSYQVLAERTKGLRLNPHASHLGELDCQVCHKMHKESIDYCSQCHGPVATGPGWKTLQQ